IINVAGFVRGSAVESRARGPHRTNALIGAGRVQRCDAASGRPRIEIGKTVAIPIAHKVSAGRAETARIPTVIRETLDHDIFGSSGGSEERRQEQKQTNSIHRRTWQNLPYE